MIRVSSNAVGQAASRRIARPAALSGTFPSAASAVAHRRILAIDLLLVVAVYAAALAFAYLYVRSERFFYYWDFVGYQVRSEWLAHLLAHDLGQAWAAFLVALPSDYNMIPSVPLAPLLMVTGPGRMPYILAIVAVYVVPFALVTGAVATRLVRRAPRRVFWTTTWLVLALPATWVAALRGYPDIGGAALLVLVLYIYLGDRTLARWRSVLWIGSLAGFAIVFRRHLAYAATVELATVSVGALAARWQSAADNARRAVLAVTASRAMVLAVVAVGTLFAIAPAFAWRALTTDYTVYYASYEIPTGVLAVYYGGHYGWLILVAGLAGLGWGLWRHDVDRGAVVLVLGAAGLFAAVWFGAARQTGQHYAYLFTAVLAVGLGLLMRLSTFRPARVALVLALLVNGIMCLSPWAMPRLTAALGSNDTRVGLLSQAIPPLRRGDYASMRGLVKQLRRVAGADRRILVAASSIVLNPDILMAADKEVRRPEEPPLRILWSPQVDSRDGYPLQALIDADLVVVATPAQYHLRPQEQDVVGALVSAFVAGRDFARNYRPLPGAFTLDMDAEARIFERIAAPSLEDVLATLATLERDIDPPPGGEDYWVHLDDRTEIVVPIDERPILPTFKTSVGAGPSALLYFGRLGAVSRLRAQVRLDSCSPARTAHLRFVPLERDGSPRRDHAASLVLTNGARLDMALPDPDAAYGLLQLEGESADGSDAACRVWLEKVSVE
ncbi:hypothetical protein [Benzoatithermus flavus]|uniref:Glycosyltransferase RgtA/B/C/D-like domain-containing protein n=1 Tax=Benzoatithermus flavus TaxID=3108223 RepID=A0ABU8XWQ4_9PROT